MSFTPSFPQFKPITLDDKTAIGRFLGKARPDTSEMTFTNLFIWRSHYNFRWSVHRDCLLILGEDESGRVYGMEPIGGSGRGEAALELLGWLREECGEESPVIERTQKGLLADLAGTSLVSVEPTRDHFDYVYLKDDLVKLEGNRYRSKRNHINKLQRTCRFAYKPLEAGMVAQCLEVQERWCLAKRCSDDLDLLGEWEAVREVLQHLSRLDVFGGTIMVAGRVEAFTVGELLKPDTMVVHIEKADPESPGFYALINQQFCANAPPAVRFVNREQDLGIPGMREAKLSYYPHHFVEKFRVRLL